jgi:ankyrin repeat protein
LLTAATKRGDLETVKRLLELKANIDSSHDGANTEVTMPCLFYAICNGNQDILELLLGKTSDVNGYSDVKGSPLHDAVRYGTPKTCESILRHGAAPSLTVCHYATPLQIAVEYCTAGTIDLLTNAEQKFGRPLETNLPSNGFRPFHAIVEEVD